MFYQITEISSDPVEASAKLNEYARRGWEVKQLGDGIALLQKPTTRYRPAMETRRGDLPCT